MSSPASSRARSGSTPARRGGKLRSSALSNKVVGNLGPEIRWLHSFVTEDKVYCVYVATDEDILYEHARCAGFPIGRVTKVAAEIDPATGD